MQTRNTDILFHIETAAQFESIEPLLTHIRDNAKLTFDVLVPTAEAGVPGSNREIYESAAGLIASHGFNVSRGIDEVVAPKEIQGTTYKLLLSAYIYEWHYKNLQAKYKIMFPYASYYFNKPNWTIEQFIQRDYMADALLSHASGTREVTDIFTKTFIVPSLKLMQYERKQTSGGKPVVFFAPTYNETSFALKFIEQINEIKKSYVVAMRAHHRTTKVKADEDISEKIYTYADTIYDAQDTSLATALGEADVVVSDNSAVIFDAIYCGVPVTLFSEDSNSFRYRDINTEQSKLVRSGEILWTDNPKKLVENIGKTLETQMLEKQDRLRTSLFPQDGTNPVEQWMSVLSLYLEDKIPEDYLHAKKYWVEAMHGHSDMRDFNAAEIEKKQAEISSLQSSIHSEQNPGVITAARRLVKACLYKTGLKKRGENG